MTFISFRLVICEYKGASEYSERLCVTLLLGQEVGVIVVIGQFVQEGPWLQDEGGQHHFGQVHAGPNLLQESPDQRFILLWYRLCLSRFASLKHKHTHCVSIFYGDIP